MTPRHHVAARAVGRVTRKGVHIHLTFEGGAVLLFGIPMFTPQE
jgi:hypothetical protein